MRPSIVVAILALTGPVAPAPGADATRLAQPAPRAEAARLAPAAKVCCEPRSLLSGCPDDYCRKPWPRIDMVSCGPPDDYCCKPYPRIWTPACGGPDDYCFKPCPDLGRPLNPDYYTCGRSGCQPVAQPAPGANAARLAQPAPGGDADQLARPAVTDKKTGRVR
jgi:hypothetical protein